MAIKIELKKPEIDVEIGDLQFKYDYSDKFIKEESKKAEEVLKTLKSMDDQTDSDEINEHLKIGFDMYLGEGAFEKIYELAPSVLEMMRIFVELRNHLEAELTKRGELIGKTQKERAKKYQNKKK